MFDCTVLVRFSQASATNAAALPRGTFHGVGETAVEQWHCLERVAGALQKEQLIFGQSMRHEYVGPGRIS